MLRRLLALTFALALIVVALAACGSDEPTTAPTDDKTATSSDLDSVEVEPGAEGAAPTLTFDQPFTAKTTLRRVLEEGDGDKAAEGSIAVFDFVFVNGRDGSQLSGSYELEPAVVTIDDNLLAGVRKGLLGLPAGSTAIVAIAPEDGFAGQGDDEASGLREDDTLLLYIDLHAVRTPLARAEGDAVTPAEGLPTVVLDDAGAPTITVPSVDAPSELVVQPLIVGKGPVVEAGDQITVHYSGVLWDTGEPFDSSWDRGAPTTFSIGTGDVIPGWDKGLVGQPVGSQVLLVIPPADGYGDSGTGSIPGGATLVFVVDILDAG